MILKGDEINVINKSFNSLYDNIKSNLEFNFCKQFEIKEKMLICKFWKVNFLYITN